MRMDDDPISTCSEAADAGHESENQDTSDDHISTFSEPVDIVFDPEDCDAHVYTSSKATDVLPTLQLLLELGQQGMAVEVFVFPFMLHGKIFSFKGWRNVTHASFYEQKASTDSRTTMAPTDDAHMQDVMSGTTYTLAAEVTLRPFFNPRSEVAAAAETLVHAILRDVPSPQDALVRVGLQLDFEFRDWQDADATYETWSGHTTVHRLTDGSDKGHTALTALAHLLQQAESTELAQGCRCWRHLSYLCVKLHLDRRSISEATHER